MSKTTGDTIPQVTLLTMQEGEPIEVSSTEVLGQGKTILFAMPGAFTSTCTGLHIPTIVENMDAFRAKGVGTVAVTCVNDPFALDAWAKATGADVAGITMLADPEAAWAEEIGLTFSLPSRGLINRSARYAMIIEGGVITTHNIDWLMGT